MHVLISLSATTQDKGRTALDSPQSTTTHADLSEYSTLEKRLRQHEEEKQKTKVAEKAAPKKTVKSKKGDGEESKEDDSEGFGDDTNDFGSDDGDESDDSGGGKGKSKDSEDEESGDSDDESGDSDEDFADDEE